MENIRFNNLTVLKKLYSKGALGSHSVFEPWVPFTMVSQVCLKFWE